jgi:hypothetical protein
MQPITICLIAHPLGFPLHTSKQTAVVAVESLLKTEFWSEQHV